jgi:hypothetical protein
VLRRIGLYQRHPGAGKHSHLGHNGGDQAKNFSDAQSGDLLATFYDDNSTFNFADGHAEPHKWLSCSVIAFANSMNPSKFIITGGAEGNAAQANGEQDLYYVVTLLLDDFEPLTSASFRCGNRLLPA